MAADGSRTHPFHQEAEAPWSLLEAGFVRLLSWGLLFFAVAALLQFIVRDQLSGTHGELKEEGEAGIVGTYVVGWHRLRLGVRDGEPRLDPSRFTVVGHVEYRGRRFDFHSGRVRFGKAVRSDPPYSTTATQRMVAETRATQDTSIRVIVEIARVTERMRARIPSAINLGQGRYRWALWRHEELTLTLERLGYDGGWVVLGWDHRRV